MIEFILNDQKIRTEKADGISLLYFIRKESHLLGTKIGCREGDCGACTVLEGSLNSEGVKYKSIVSCLTPLINAQGKHIVTIEGLNMDELSPVQKAMTDNAATQCGFCTPGFVVSLTGHLLSNHEREAVESISGNICRCTGYKSIEKAAHHVDDLKKTLEPKHELENLVKIKGLPEYFLFIPERLSKIKKSVDKKQDVGEMLIGGGTDLMVQESEKIRQSKLRALKKSIPHTVEIENEKIKVGAGININAFFDNQIINSNFPQFKEFFPLIASEQIRNMGTLAGNIVNASPIGDLSILLLALDANLILENGNGKTRQLKLSEFFIDYKKTELAANEIIKFIVFDTLEEGGKFDFAKVSKRTYLDIASVNSAISIVVKNGLIEHFNFSAGGIAPIPKYFSKTKKHLIGKKLELSVLESAMDKLQHEIFPISDIRGSEEYKRLLVRQLFLRHFLTLFPEVFKVEDIHNLMTTNTLHYEKY